MIRFLDESTDLLFMTALVSGSTWVVGLEVEAVWIGCASLYGIYKLFKM